MLVEGEEKLVLVVDVLLPEETLREASKEGMATVRGCWGAAADPNSGME